MLHFSGDFYKSTLLFCIYYMRGLINVSACFITYFVQVQTRFPIEHIDIKFLKCVRDKQTMTCESHSLALYFPGLLCF